MIELNQTLLYQIITFFILLYALTRLLYKPVFNILDERKRRTEGFRADASEAEEKIKKGTQEYEKRLKDAAQAGQGERAEIKRLATEKHSSLLDAAKGEAKRDLSRVKAELEKGKASAIASLKGEIPAISKTIVELLLERKLTVVVALLFIPSWAFASEGGESQTAIYWKVFNFTLLAAGAYVVWKKFIKGLLEQRGAEIKKAIEEAEGFRRASEEKLKEFEEKLSRLDAMAAEIRRLIILEAEAERDSILGAAITEAERIKAEAKTSAEEEKKRVSMEARTAIASSIIDAAGEFLKKELTEDDQKRLIKSYLDMMRMN